jgi:hypothetical protein
MSNLRILTVLAALLIPAMAANAQFTMTWCTIDGGGGTSSSASLTLRGTIGQHDAGVPMVSGEISVTGGFWPAAVPPTVTCGIADFDGDGDSATDFDIEAFFACLAGNCCATCFVHGADFNVDGDSATDADIEAFFRVLAGGSC